MTYIYDIILNFQKNYYDFFEWQPQDKITNISKIAIYHVSDKDFLILKNNDVVVEEHFINTIKKDNKKQKKIMCIVSNNKKTIAILFNNKGVLLKRSSLIFEEEEEAIELSKNIKITNINYKKNIFHPYKNILRVEKEKKDTIISYIKKTNDISVLKYLHYNYYLEDSDNINFIKNKLIKDLSKEWNEKQKNIYKIVNILKNINI